MKKKPAKKKPAKKKPAKKKPAKKKQSRKMVFCATEGAQFNTKRVQVYGVELKKLESKYGSDLKAQHVERAARSSKNPLHECFEWDGDKAAYLYRLTQARHLMSHIDVEVIVGGVRERADGWINVQGSYQPPDLVLSDKDKFLEFVNELIGQIDYWRQKCKKYYQLSKVFVGADRELRKIRARLKKK